MGNLKIRARTRPPVLTARQKEVLSIIDQCKGRVTTKDVAAGMGVNIGNAGKMIRRLQAKGFLRKTGIEVVI